MSGSAPCGSRWLSLLMAGGALLASAALRAEERSAPQACLRFVGDATLARGVAAEMRARGQSPWDGFPRDAALVGNLEGALGDFGTAACSKDPRLCLGLRSPDLEVLRSAGFLAVSLENNHSRDYGDEARESLARRLEDLRVAPITAETSPRFLDTGTLRAPVRWGLVALDLTVPDPGARQRAAERARLQVGRAAAEAEHVAVLVHWGIEGDGSATAGQREMAERLSSWGADVVIGSHPHEVQEFACSAGGLTAYSLGNHLFDGFARTSWTGAAVTCCTRLGTTTCRADATERTQRSTFPRWTGREVAAPCPLPERRPDLAWKAHRQREQLLFVQPMRSAGDHAFFALHRRYSSFDREEGLRPYVFRVRERRTIDLWRGTALGFPLVAARLVEVRGQELLCALHSGDSFLVRQPTTLARRWLAYRWNGFGFDAVTDGEATRSCERH